MTSRSNVVVAGTFKVGKSLFLEVSGFTFRLTQKGTYESVKKNPQTGRWIKTNQAVFYP